MISISTGNDKTMEDMDRLISLYGDELLRMCFLYLKDIHLAEDALQDTFVKIHKNHNKFNGKCGEKTWITRIAINVCKDYLKTSWRKHIDENAILECIPCQNDMEVTQDDTLIVEIMKLSPKYKEVILLYYYQSFKIKEIAEILKKPEATISIRLKRAREALKSNLKGWYYDE